MRLSRLSRSVKNQRTMSDETTDYSFLFFIRLYLQIAIRGQVRTLVKGGSAILKAI